MNPHRIYRLLGVLVGSAELWAAPPPVDYRVQLDVVHRGYDGQTCWVHPRAGVIPGETPAVVLTMQQLLLTGSDVFFAWNELRTDDLGRTWSGPCEHAATLGRRNEPDGVVVATCDFTPQWHARSGKLFVTVVNDRETWVTVAEWMQTWGPNIVIPPDNKYGADNTVYAARLLWDVPNAGRP